MRVTAGVAVVAVGAVLLIVALAGCGGSGRGRASAPFGWLKPASPPTGWNVARTRGGAMLAYPPGWKPIKTDPGTASVALLGNRGERIDGYLNATHKQGNETLADWTRFRPQHNQGEGDRAVRLVAATTNARFRAGHGACVVDTYTTSRASYREIACLVSGPRSTAVVVAAAPTALWDQLAATLQRAVSSFVA
jgi:hypothetical protein